MPSKPDAPVGVLMCDVEAEDVDWIWEGKVPRRKLIVVEGQPDNGKTTLALDLAARVTTGDPMPLEAARREPGGVVIVTAEDGLGDTIRPRLEAAGADLSRVLAARPDESPSLDEEGLTWLRRACDRVQPARLVVIDPLVAMMPGAVNGHVDQDVRRMFRPLRALAEECGVAILLIRHLRKAAATSPKDAGGGSIGITAAARVVMLAGVAPDDPDRRILARVKGNLAPTWPSISYRLVPERGTVRIVWEGETEATAEEVLSAGADAAADRHRERAADGAAARKAEEARQRARLREDAVTALAREVVARDAKKIPFKLNQAVDYLQTIGLRRDEARALLNARDGERWTLREVSDERGRPTYVEPPPEKEPTGKSLTKSVSYDLPIPPTLENKAAGAMPGSNGSNSRHNPTEALSPADIRTSLGGGASVGATAVGHGRANGEIGTDPLDCERLDLLRLWVQSGRPMIPLEPGVNIAATVPCFEEYLATADRAGLAKLREYLDRYSHLDSHLGRAGEREPVA